MGPLPGVSGWTLSANTSVLIKREATGDLRTDKKGASHETQGAESSWSGIGWRGNQLQNSEHHRGGRKEEKEEGQNPKMTKETWK